MLQEIQTVEKEVEQKVEQAKHDAAVAIQHARTEAATARKKLNERLHAQELEAIATAEKAAETEAATLVEKATAAAPVDTTTKAASIAKEVVAMYVK